MRCWPHVVAAVAAAAPPVAEKKLLYPIMIQGGPNNQYQQFLESMLLAKTLRRKIVLAPFLSWPGGGDRHHLHSIGQLLRDNRAPFETRTLPTGFGDYVIARRRARVDVARGCGNDVAPVLIERKYAAVHKSIFAAVLPRPTHNLHACTDALVDSRTGRPSTSPRR